MSTTSSHTRSKLVPLTRAQKWVVHAMLVTELDRSVEREHLPQWWIVQLIEKVETETIELSQFEAWGIRALLAIHAGSTELPQAERSLADQLVERLDTTFGEPPGGLILDD